MGICCCLMNLLTADEKEIDRMDYKMRFDIGKNII